MKNTVFAEIDGFIAPDALLCSNTSTLPITLLGENVSRTEDFIGLHFFSPVDKMPLVEIIKGEKTSDAALGRALAVVRQIGKTPIVVNDSRGFFTSRVIGTFTNEGIAMLGEGVSPVSIEQAASQAGYPAPVLALMDELTLTLPRKIREETKAAILAEGKSWEPHPADSVVDRMIDEFGRKGRSTGAGFYEYADGKRVGLWSGLETFRRDGAHTEIPFEDIKERMLFIEAVETVRCLEEGVLESTTDATSVPFWASATPAGPVAWPATSTSTRAGSRDSSPGRSCSPRGTGTDSSHPDYCWTRPPPAARSKR